MEVLVEFDAEAHERPLSGALWWIGARGVSGIHFAIRMITLRDRCPSRIAPGGDGTYNSSCPEGERRPSSFLPLPPAPVAAPIFRHRPFSAGVRPEAGHLLTFVSADGRAVSIPPRMSRSSAGEIRSSAITAACLIVLRSSRIFPVQECACSTASASAEISRGARPISWQASRRNLSARSRDVLGDGP